MKLVKYFNEVVRFSDLAKKIREAGTDTENLISNDFLIQESYSLGEWEEMHPRLSEYGKGMSQGWYMDGFYYPTTNGAEKHVKEWGFNSLDEYFASDDVNEECYWTDWEIELGEDELFSDSGVAFEWCEKRQWWFR